MALNQFIFVLFCTGFVNTHWIEPEIRELKSVVTVSRKNIFRFFLHFIVYCLKNKTPSQILAADYLNICAKSDENPNDCLKTSIDAFRLALTNGIPNVDTPSIDPLDIGDLFESHKKRHEINVKVQHIIVMGILKFKIDKIE